jgi:hypothetical protein
MKYQLKSKPIEALRWDGLSEEEFQEFCLRHAMRNMQYDHENQSWEYEDDSLKVQFKDGAYRSADVGFWVIKDLTLNDMRIMSNEQFIETYEMVGL